MKFLIITSCLLYTLTGFAQSTESRDLNQQFVTAYNNGDYEEVYKMFEAEMQNDMSQNQLTELMQGLNSGAAKIKNVEFVTRDSEGLDHYKTTFEVLILDLAILSSNDGKISGFKVLPYNEEEVLRDVHNSLNQETTTVLSLAQTSKIYSLAKEFPNSTELSIALIENGQTKFYGVRILNDTMSSVNNYKDIFEIGSLSIPIALTP